MTTFAFPLISPSFINWSLVSNTEVSASILNGAIQTKDRGGERWQIEMRFQNLSGDRKAEMKAFLAQLNGQRHRFTVHDFSQVQRGTFEGTPIVNGVGQTGTSLIIDGCDNSITNWIRAGDHFEVGGSLKMAIADASSDSGGDITIPFAPRILVAPTNASPITTLLPTGVFVLSGRTSGWSNQLGDFSTFVVNAFEDIVA